jgi:hypothetical protein
MNLKDGRVVSVRFRQVYTKYMAALVGLYARGKSENGTEEERDKDEEITAEIGGKAPVAEGIEKRRTTEA